MNNLVKTQWPDKANDGGFDFTGPGGQRGRAVELPGGIGALLAATLLGGLGRGLGDRPPAEGDTDDHPLLKKLGLEPPAPFRAASKEEFLKFFGDGWEQFQVGDIVEVRAGFQLDSWPKVGEQAIVSQVLETPIRRGAAFTEQMGRRNDVALVFVQNTDAEVLEAMAEAGQPEQQRIYEFLYDSRRLKKVGSVF